MEKDFSFVGVVGGDFYQEYIPIFIYSALKSYPNYNIIIYIVGKLRSSIRKSLNLLKPLGTFKIKENALSIIFNFNKVIENEQNLFDLSKGYHIPYLRWLIIDEELLHYKYIYLCDIDIFIVPEQPTLLEQHKNHMRKTKLCYSNKIRATSNEFERLTGLHFIKTREYYKKTKEIIKKYQKLFLKNKLNFDNDEKLLYHIVLESDLEMISKNETFRPHHGIHFGLFKSFNVPLINERFSFYKSYVKLFLDMVKDDIFIQIFRNIKNLEMKLLILRAKLNYKQKLEGNFLRKLKYQYFEIILTFIHFSVHLKNKIFKDKISILKILKEGELV